MRIEEVIRDLRHGRGIRRKSSTVDRLITYDANANEYILIAFGREYYRGRVFDISVYELTADDWESVDLQNN